MHNTKLKDSEQNNAIKANKEKLKLTTRLEKGNCGRPAKFINVLVHYIEVHGMNQSTITIHGNALKKCILKIAKRGMQINLKIIDQHITTIKSSL